MSHRILMLTFQTDEWKTLLMLRKDEMKSTLTSLEHWTSPVNSNQLEYVSLCASPFVNIYHELSLAALLSQFHFVTFLKILFLFLRMKTIFWSNMQKHRCKCSNMKLIWFTSLSNPAHSPPPPPSPTSTHTNQGFVSFRCLCYTKFVQSLLKPLPNVPVIIAE